MIKGISKLVSLVVLVLFCSGCLVARHSTTSTSSSGVTTVDSGSVKGFMASTAAGSIGTRTSISTNGTYIHSTSAKDLIAKGDSEFINALGQALGAALAQALETAKKSQGIP
jgi:hypothetical protein